MKKTILISAITFITFGLILVPIGIAISPQAWYLFLMSAFGFAVIVFLLLLYGTESINEKFTLIMVGSDKAHSELFSAISEIQNKLESSTKSLVEAINTLQKKTVEEISSSVQSLTESNNKCLEEIKSVCKEFEKNEATIIEKESDRITNCFTNNCQRTIESILNLQKQIRQSISDANDSLCSLNKAYSEKILSSHKQSFSDITSLLMNSELEHSKNIGQAADKLTDALSQIESICKEVGKKNNELITDIAAQYNNVLDKIGQKENELVESLERTMEGNLKDQQESIGKVVNGLSETVTTTIDRLYDNIKLTFDDYTEALSNNINKIKDDFERSLEENQSGFNKVVRDIRVSLDDIRKSTDNLQETLGGDLSDTLDNLAGYIKHYDELKQTDINTIKEIENLCRKK